MGPCKNRGKDFTKNYILISSRDDFNEFVVGIRKIVKEGRLSYKFLRSDEALVNVCEGKNYHNIKNWGAGFGLNMDEDLCLKKVLIELIRR
ncbi:MAG: hypothetical protein DRP06_03070 [Candidatus Aenigmatarchaeota archaeon]|nr:MAG: hypothetical protein DRP06_03070 [Candidatus Aenigmarchaeota archaeon]